MSNFPMPTEQGSQRFLCSLICRETPSNKGKQAYHRVSNRFMIRGEISRESSLANLSEFHVCFHTRSLLRYAIVNCLRLTHGIREGNQGKSSCSRHIKQSKYVVPIWVSFFGVPLWDWIEMETKWKLVIVCVREFETHGQNMGEVEGSLVLVALLSCTGLGEVPD